MREAGQFFLQIYLLAPCLVFLLQLRIPLAPFPARVFELIGQLFLGV